MKKDKFQHRTNEELKKLILKNKFTDNDFRVILNRSEEFKSIKFRKRVKKND